MGYGSVGNDKVAMYYANLNHKSSADYEREMHERGLQKAEQARRQYDSETQRQGQQQKFGVLGGLLRGANSGPYGQGMQSLGGFSVDGKGTMTRF